MGLANPTGEARRSRRQERAAELGSVQLHVVNGDGAPVLSVGPSVHDETEPELGPIESVLPQELARVEDSRLAMRETSAASFPAASSWTSSIGTCVAW